MPQHASAINFQSEVVAGGSLELQKPLDRDGVVTRLYVVAVPGEETDVRRYLEVVRNGRDPVNLVDAATAGTDTAEEYLAGDDTVWNVPVHEEFSSDDVLQMRIENDDANNSYPNIAYATVRYGDPEKILEEM
jgi:hypothetical protein